MVSQLAGPVVLDSPLVVYAGESLKLRAEVRDGVVTSAKPYGAAVEISEATKKGLLRIDEPDGAADLTRDTSVGAEGAKALTSQGSSEGRTKDAFEFYVAASVTTGWAPGLHAFEVEYQDSGATPEADAKLVLVGRISVKPKPSAS